MAVLDPVPKRLVAGMAVVVKFEPTFAFLKWELAASIVPNKWLKGKLVGLSSDGWYSISINDERISFCTGEAIIIRSTAKQDNIKPWITKRKARNQLKKLARSVKVVRSEIK